MAYQGLHGVCRGGIALDVAARNDSACFTAIGFNVLQHNREYARTLVVLQREQPDVLLLMETDSLWLAALEPFHTTYPHVSPRALDNTYGMVFATRLDVDDAQFRHPTSADTPTFYATLTTQGGQSFDFVGLHPRPPLPGQDTDKRDASIARAARRQDHDLTPALAMGDFNDGAWSRGLDAAFPASYTLAGWPLDRSS